MEEEILDIVNAQDEVVGQIKRSDSSRVASEQHGFLRAVDMFIHNSEGKIWIPTRTADKVIAPNGLDYSCGGHVSTGEDYDTTIMRETEEELNFILELDRLRFIKVFPPAASPYFRAVYLYSSDETPKFNPQDFVSAEWLFPRQVIDKLDAGVPAKGSIKETILELIKVGELH